MTPLAAGMLRSLVFIFGCLIGSFLGATAYRVPRGMSIVGPRSQCPSCGHVLGPLDLVPILSFIWRHGRCGYCGEPISWRYPLVEGAAGLLALGLFMRYGLGWEFALYLLVAFWALLLAAIDIEHHRLPNVLTIPGMVAGFLINIAWRFSGDVAVTVAPGGGWQGVWHGALVDPSIWAGWEALAPTFSPLHSILGIVVGGGVLWFIAMASHGGMGGGDVKFLAAIGAFLGPGAALLVLFLGALLGSVVGIGLIVSGRLQRRQPMPFGPYLAAGVVALALFG